MQIENIDLYAHITSEFGGFELSIGRDIPGQVSHGAAAHVGIFDTIEDATRYARSRGVCPERIEIA